jgi:hypothetical protein
VKVACLAPSERIQIVVYEKIDIEVAPPWQMHDLLSAGQPAYSACNSQGMS